MFIKLIKARKSMAIAKKATEKASAVQAETPRAGQAGKKKDALDHAVDLISPTFDFTVASFRDLFARMLKVELASYAAIAVLLIAIAIVTGGILLLGGMLPSGNMGIYDKLASNPSLLAAIAAWLILAFLALVWITKSFSAVSLVIAKEQYEGKYSGIWTTFNRIKFPMLSYLLLSFAIVAAGLGLPLALLYFASTLNSAVVFALGVMAYLIYIFVFLVVYYFFTQFWIWELLIAGKGVTQSLSDSISLAKGNLIGVFVFDIFAVVASVLVAVPFMALGFAVAIAFEIASVAALVVSPFAYLGILVLYLLLRLALVLVQSAATDAAILPYRYSFWDAIRKK